MRKLLPCELYALTQLLTQMIHLRAVVAKNLGPSFSLAFLFLSSVFTLPPLLPVPLVLDFPCPPCSPLLPPLPVFSLVLLCRAFAPGAAEWPAGGPPEMAEPGCCFPLASSPGALFLSLSLSHH